MIAMALIGMLLALPIPEESNRIVDPLKLSPEIEQFLDERVSRALPPMKRLDALIDVVFRRDELGFTYSPASRTALETFDSRNGNCLSFTLMLIAMARHLDLDARFREVDIPPLFTKHGSFVILRQHLNVAVFIDGEVYTIDVFPQIVPIQSGGRIVADQRGFAHFFNNMGVDELGHADYELAELNFAAALQVDPTMDGVYVNLGGVRARTGRLLEAEQHYRKALELNSNNYAAMSSLAAVYEKTGKFKEAARLQKKVKKFRDRNPYYHFSLGLGYWEQGNHSEALAHLKRAIKLNPDDHTFYFAVARIHALLGDRKKMESNLQLAKKYAVDPDNKLLYAQKLDLLKNSLH